MKLGFCFAAFVIGCLFAVLMRPAESDDQAHDSASTLLAISNAALDLQQSEMPEMGKLTIAKAPFGTFNDQQVSKYTLRNVNGLSVSIVEYGAIITEISTPDRDGNFANIVLSCDSLAGYRACTSYFGAAVGRFCNRIANSQFAIDGTTHQLSANEGPHHLHGGNLGFDRRLWSTEEIVDADAVGLRLTLTSEDGDQGYPGGCTVKVTYSLDNQDQLKIEFTAQSDAKTPVNLTNHSYFNLDGAGAGPIFDQVLQIDSDQILTLDDANLPTGDFQDVAQTRFDFTAPRPIGPAQSTPKEFAGYDHNFCLRSQDNTLTRAATAYSPASGRQMTIATTQPGIQLYTGNFLDGRPGSGGFEKQTAFCLETQHYPDSPNQSKFPSTILAPGDTYQQTTVMSFSVAD